MPTINIAVGPFAAIYVGDYGDSDVLTQIFSLGTGVQTLVDEVPEEYLPVLDNSIQTGIRESFS